ncbi:hypothetical protein TWF694_003339 [Orbilia ellipsospora]|uniref:Uncharacterized protein n=1 Tax=Orbilia ellipsospora TaxID=2528407 RepID=A0AAV9X275_9PEZI
MDPSTVVFIIKLAHGLLDGINTFNQLPTSIRLFLQQVDQLYRTLQVLKDRVQYRKSKRSSSASALQEPQDPGETLLANLFRGIQQTHDETERFLSENGIRNKYGNRFTWNTDILVNKWSIFQQENIRRRLSELQQAYHFHAVQTTIVSQTILSQTSREFPAQLAENSHHEAPAVSERVRDPKLLRHLSRRPRQNSSTFSSGSFSRPTATYTETSYYETQTALEDAAYDGANSDYSESQKWLFNRFEEEMRFHQRGIRHFEILNLLNKVVFWLSNCNPEWPLDAMEYTTNYVQLMKAAWLLQEIMHKVPSSRIQAKFTESYLVEIQYMIITYYPTREPPELSYLYRLPTDDLLLNLTQLERVIPTLRVDEEEVGIETGPSGSQEQTMEFQPGMESTLIAEFPAFQRQVNPIISCPSSKYFFSLIKRFIQTDFIMVDRFNFHHTITAR